MKEVTKKDVLKFCLLASLGIFLYFIPVVGTSVPVVWLVGVLKGFVAPYTDIFVLLLIGSLLVFTILGKMNVKGFEVFGKGVSKFKMAMIIASLVFAIFIIFDLPPVGIFSHPDIANTVPITLTVFSTVAVCGAFVVFILKSGIVEFTGTLLEPLMRPLFKLPGAAAVNMITSYVVSAAVGIFMSDQYYENKVYNRREAVSSAVCFSTISIGFIGVLCGMANIPEYYGLCLILTFALVFVLTPLFVRIPPLSKIENVYIDGSTEYQSQDDDLDMPLFKKAVYRASLKSREFTLEAVSKSFLSAFRFGQSIGAGQLPIMVVTLSIVVFTPLFDYLGMPFVPILNLLGLENAVEIAPAILLGFVSITLPAISITNLTIAAQSAFFVVMLSITQIIFISEPVNAFLATKMKVSFLDALANFVVRTIIAIPVIALISHLIF